MLASSTVSLGYILLAIIVAGFIIYAVASRTAARPELGSEIELAANRKPYYDDEILEGRRLERVQFIGLLFLLVSVIGLPLYWILEPARQVGAKEYSVERATEWGAELFAPTAKGGFKRSHAFKRHILTKKSPKTIRDLRGPTMVHASDNKEVRQLLPYA